MSERSGMTAPLAPPPAPRRRRLSPGQRVILAVGGVLAFALIGWGVLSLVSVFGRTSYQRELTLAPSGAKLHIDLPGTIQITGASGSDSQVRLVETVRYGLRKPHLVESRTADGLTVRMDCSWFDSRCSVDAVVTVPASTSVDARSSGGDITVRGLTGSVRLDSSGGGVTGADLTGSVEMRSSGGDVTATGLTGQAVLDSSGGGISGSGLRSPTVDASSSGGDVNLSFDAAPDQVHADSSGGGVEVRLPRVENGYHVTADSSGGATRIEVPTDPQSPRLIDAHSSGGDVRIVTQ
jgi:hypothetical protein